MALPSPLRLVKAAQEFISVGEVNSVPRGLRGIYVLYKKKGRKRFDVVYVGMAGEGGIRPRLQSHRRRIFGPRRSGSWRVCFAIFIEGTFAQVD
jgi:hypothetical protein